jgi:protein involved in polysaccharide export with SLBB domain
LLQPRDRIHVFDREGGRETIVEPILRDLERQATSERPARVVSVRGLVHAPGRYPLEPGMTVSDLLRAGGGLLDAAYGERAELARFEVRDNVQRQTSLVAVNLAGIGRGDRAGDVALQPYDSLSVSEVEDWDRQGTIELAGEVRFPGRYQIRRGETLRSVVERAGGLTPLAFPGGSVFTRVHLREREQQQIVSLTDRLEADLASLALQSAQSGGSGQGAQALAVGQQLLSQLQTAQPVGRLVINLPAIMRTQNGGGLDVVLRDGDRLLVPRLSQEVTVIGEVQNATSHFHRAGVDRDDYIDLSGGLTARADRQRIYVVRADGSVVIDERAGWFRQGADIQPGDTVVVPLEADRIRPLTLWTSVSQILYNVAVAVAAVNSF